MKKCTVGRVLILSIENRVVVTYSMWGFKLSCLHASKRIMKEKRRFVAARGRGCLIKDYYGINLKL